MPARNLHFFSFLFQRDGFEKPCSAGKIGLPSLVASCVTCKTCWRVRGLTKASVHRVRPDSLFNPLRYRAKVERFMSDTCLSRTVQIALNYNSRIIIPQPRSRKPMVTNNESRHATRRDKNVERRISIYFRKASRKIDNLRTETRDVRVWLDDFARYGFVATVSAADKHSED